MTERKERSDATGAAREKLAQESYEAHWAARGHEDAVFRPTSGMNWRKVHGEKRIGWLAVADAVLAQRKEREGPLVAVLNDLGKAGHFGVNEKLIRAAREALAAHAALDTPPTLAEELVREMPHLAGAHAEMSVAEVVRIVEAVIARERGK